ncbi:MAG: hypothetical protein K9G62_03165 [Alphaproteobacteria bacterium]|nr:hypothetical protein [Alphaproteobacteria bacterium]
MKEFFEKARKIYRQAEEDQELKNLKRILQNPKDLLKMSPSVVVRGLIRLEPARSILEETESPARREWGEIAGSAFNTYILNQKKPSETAEALRKSLDLLPEKERGSYYEHFPSEHNPGSRAWIVKELDEMRKVERRHRNWRNNKPCPQVQHLQELLLEQPL